jgi:hypothetical protein
MDFTTHQLMRLLVVEVVLVMQVELLLLQDLQEQMPAEVLEDLELLYQFLDHQ